MSEFLSAAGRVLGREITVIDYICETAAAACAQDADGSRPCETAYWESVRDARKNGKKLIFLNGPVPVEILYAMDCVPLCLDLLPSRISQDGGLTAKFIYEAEVHANSELCSLNKTVTGVLLQGNLGVVPDAYVSLPIPCDSARAACTELTRFIDAPHFHFDIPVRFAGNGLGYIGAQLERLIGFLEELTGKKLDWDKVQPYLAGYNRAAELLERCTELRAAKPCPMSAHLPLWDELMNAFGPTEAMAELLKRELTLCEKRRDAGFSPCVPEEKHRLMLLHNYLWQGLELTDWLEKSYGTVTVLDGFCYGPRERYTRPDDRADSISVMCRRISKGARAHGSGVSGEELFTALEGLLPTYAPDVFILLGSRGCKHFWAGTKLFSDKLHEKYGFPMLLLDVDNTDSRYKPLDEVKQALAQYIDTVINKK